LPLRFNIIVCGNYVVALYINYGLYGICCLLMWIVHIVLVRKFNHRHLIKGTIGLAIGLHSIIDVKLDLPPLQIEILFK